MGKESSIVSITLEYGGFFGGTERRKVFFDGEKIVVERNFYNGASNLGEELFVGVTKNDFLSDFVDIHVENWNTRYDNNGILDGTQWGLTVEYEDGQTDEFYGSNEYPDNFDKLLELMEMEA